MKGKVITLVSGAPSGALNIAMTLAENLRDSFVSPIILRKYNKAGIKEALVVKDRFTLDFIWSLIQVLKSEKPDLILVHGYSTHLWAKIASAKAHIPIIHVEHNVEKYTWLRRKILQWTDRYTDAYVCVSQGVAKHLISQGADPRKIQVIYNGIDPKEFAAVQKVEHPVFTVGMTARFSSQKDQLTLIKAIEYLRKQKKIELRLILQGSGKYKKKCEDYVKNHGLEEEITFETGRLTELASKVDLFVLATHYEGLPLVLAEAMAAGIPVIGTNVPGVDEIIKDGINGYLTPHQDWKALAEIIENWHQLHINPQGLSLIEKGQETVKKRFSLDRMCREYRDLVNAVLQKSRNRKMAGEEE